MFINRQQELTALEERWRSGRGELVVVYGRRRVGKTALLQHFGRDKRQAFFLASQLREPDNLRQFTEVLRGVFDDPFLTALPAFPDWEAALIYLAQRAATEPLLVVLDEFPYLCGDNPALPSLVQRFWDLHGQRGHLFLVLCGSQISFMERELLAERSPLFGRRTAQLHLKPLSYREAAAFFPIGGPREKLLACGILGGIPAYLARFDPISSVRDNLLRECLSPTGALYDEVDFLLRMELQDPKTYASILQAIAGGCTKLNEIGQRVRLETPKVTKYLGVLRELGLVRREVPVTERAPERSRHGRYGIQDPFVRFWFRFVLPYRSLLEAGHGATVYDRSIAPQLNTYMGGVFEDICREYVRRYWPERLGRAPAVVGRHWGAGGDIDVVTENLDGSHFLGECKWWEGPVGENILEELLQRARTLSLQFQQGVEYLLFAVGSFTPELEKRAAGEGKVHLISVSNLLGTGSPFTP